MDFKKATDDLLSCISHKELADALECSVATVRQARLDESALARRAPPQHWKRVVAKLADQKAAHFSRLAQRLRA